MTFFCRYNGEPPRSRAQALKLHSRDWVTFRWTRHEPVMTWPERPGRPEREQRPRDPVEALEGWAIATYPHIAHLYADDPGDPLDELRLAQVENRIIDWALPPEDALPPLSLDAPMPTEPDDTLRDRQPAPYIAPDRAVIATIALERAIYLSGPVYRTPLSRNELGFEPDAAHMQEYRRRLDLRRRGDLIAGRTDYYKFQQDPDPYRNSLHADLHTGRYDKAWISPFEDETDWPDCTYSEQHDITRQQAAWR